MCAGVGLREKLPISLRRAELKSGEALVLIGATAEADRLTMSIVPDARQ